MSITTVCILSFIAGTLAHYLLTPKRHERFQRLAIAHLHNCARLNSLREDLEHTPFCNNCEAVARDILARDRDLK